MIQLNIQDSILFSGELSDKELRNEISKAQVFVSASEYEGFGISAIEAMASGTPCILNHIESFKQFIYETNSGIITDFSNAKQSADNIVKILEMDIQQYNFISESVKKNAKRYSWDVALDKIISVYEDVLK